MIARKEPAAVAAQRGRFNRKAGPVEARFPTGVRRRALEPVRDNAKERSAR